MWRQIEDVSFHAYSSRVCLPNFPICAVKFSVLSAYFPTSWDDESEIEAMYEILQLILTNIRGSGARIVIGGDINANVGIFNGRSKRRGTMGFRFAECSRCYIGQLDFDEWVANCKSTIVSQQCGQLDLPKDNGWNQGAVTLYFKWCSCLCWIGVAWPIDTNWIGPSLCALRSSLGWCETTFTEQTIEFEKLDANSGCWWSREFVSKLFEGNVAKNVKSFLLRKWKTIWYFWCKDCFIQTIPSAQGPPQQPAPNCWYREEEGIVVPYPKAPSTRISPVEI